MNYQIMIIIILLILLIGSFGMMNRVFSYYKKYEYAHILTNVTISNIYNSLKTGDIILFKCNTLFLPNILLTHIYFTHIGMVIKKKNSYKDNIENDIYISETNPSDEYLPRDYNKKSGLYKLKPFISKKNGWKSNYGTDLLPLLVRLKYYPGDCFIMRLNKPLDKRREDILAKCVLEKCPYPTPFQGLKIFIEEKFGKNYTNSICAKHCFQHVGNLLDKIELTNNILKSGIISICNKVAYLSENELNDGYMYEIPKKIIYDI